ncbi:RNA 2'-phosphotransferase [Panacibacter ginsenosidivorans]|uniref:Probable RNA 2'-phosphotransferase n=1 Tax=Panacibacter ginsenosidivorans TaxID=1813871 RepID=A0A5B8V7U5_9BACT|nr:RNA 2'-phosphotransferase [Panacibacter ginsenosidivorans]QEC66891.1 RNA 2'-phosphotransferase [Panacibacter ginsenosidivorans]
MLSEKENTKLSKLLSYILRHKPEEYGIELGENGYTNVDELITKLNAHNENISFEILQHIVDTNNKKRFAFNEDLTKIRASQGHSVDVELGYTEQQPPEILYHGTVEKFLIAIMKDGLQKMKRHHVHLSADKTIATKVAERRGKPIILEIKAAEMFAAGYTFYHSDNGVWLTDHVPVEFIES